MSFAGFNIGAVTVKGVVLRGAERIAAVAGHRGRPLRVLDEMLAGPEFADVAFVGVAGQLGDVPEVAAIQRALQELAEGYDVVASLGGESFLVYTVVDGRIAHVLSPSKCAAGSGEFFVQQIGRMGIGLDEAVERSFAGRVVPLASRCSVHCKSDITHKLNRHEATPEDILRTLHDSMAGKVAALLEKAPRTARRVLLIGGVTRNAAMLAALRERQPATRFEVLPQSPWFEAWGCALLTRDRPTHRRPQLAPAPRPGRLPPLGAFAGSVRVISAPPRLPPSGGPLILGVDAGSTTTKAILLDPATQQIVGSHYRRTAGDPVAATRGCLRALLDAIGDQPLGLVAATGSARELIGAYLGTAYVYNEISAHATGAAHFDGEVDTLFEIGGQDSKYILLRNGVPIDYAMNNACSAGTGSFLEESAQTDLGVATGDIARMALAAPAPVQFKTTCAAFINSDIRIAQQQGASREDIVAGLVYAIAGNYLNRVRGARPVGAKVFLQGGVALNAAVGHAFAQRLERPIVIPPNPELLGALGVALLAQARANGSLGAPHALAALLLPEMNLGGRFTCRACDMGCGIERFEVAGRKFPFGGRCSRYENGWKQGPRAAPVPDLVEQRAAILFAGARAARDRPAVARARAGGKRLGIPRALTTHSLYPLYATFFGRLGFGVELSGIDPAGEAKANSAFCLPAQIAHGAVLDLIRREVDLVFLPHVSRMPQPPGAREAFLCPITQASPYFLTKAFPGVRILSPLLDFTGGYHASTALEEFVVRELGISGDAARIAWAAATEAQSAAERRLRELGRSALDSATAAGQPAILLAGHSYNAFTPEASQSVGRKLASMGVVTIPADCLTPHGNGATAWHFANEILNAVGIAQRHPNVFLLCVGNFSCTIDAFTQAAFAAELGDKPHLVLEIDAHTADGGVQTRLEAFLDIVRSYRARRTGVPPRAQRCRLGPGGTVILSGGGRIPLGDPRVRIYVPNFSTYHAGLFRLAIRWLGLHPGRLRPLGRTQLERGLQHTSGRECLPLPLCVGQLLQIHAQRAPGEIVGYYTVRGGAPCVSDAYMGFLERFVAEQNLADVFVFCPGAGNDFLGVGEVALARHIAPAIVVADLLVEIDHVLQVVGRPGSLAQFRRDWRTFAAGADSLEAFHRRLPQFVERLAALPRTRVPGSCPRVVVTGDFFTRFDPFFMAGVRELYAARGIILKPVDLGDLMLYRSYDDVAGMANGWGLKPGSLAFALACTRMFQRDGRKYLQSWIGYHAERIAEWYYRSVFARSGLLVAGPNNIPALFATAAEHVSPAIFGEIIPAVGKGLGAEGEGYNGTILLGPFNCLPYRIAESILRPLSLQRGLPILTYETDGYAVASSVLRQVEVHIQQVLEHAARRQTAPARADPGR
jgi:predicted CoA-substrate-specific enzyme activase